MEIEGSNGREGSAFTRFCIHVCCTQRKVIVGGLYTLLQVTSARRLHSTALPCIGIGQQGTYMDDCIV